MPRRWINCRVVVRVCTLLLLGAVFTVAAAWGPAIWFGWVDQYDTQSSVATNEEIRWWRRTVSPAVEDEPNVVIRWDRSLVPYDWVAMQSLQIDHFIAAQRGRFGLPLRSLVYSTWVVDPGALDDSNRHTSRHRSFDVHRNRTAKTVILPLTPIWPGFAVDTLFFATLSALILAGWRRLIRRRRLNRGRCPACKYPIGTSPVCTECGEALCVDMSPCCEALGSSALDGNGA